MKACSKCKKEKPLNSFARCSKRGTQNKCKDCVKEYDRQRYLKRSHIEKEQVRSRRHKYREEHQKYVYNYLLAHPCIDCAEADPVVLEFDHRDRETKKYNIGDIFGKCSLETIKKEIAKCDVRCANCHRRRTAKQFKFAVWRFGV